MKSKKALLGFVLAFVLLMGGASVLYHQLGQDMGAQQMIVHEEQPTEAPAAEAMPQETAPITADAAASEPEPEVIPAPDFVVYDEGGNEVKLSQYFGKPIVLNFWASWCGPCQSEMPDFNEKYLEQGEDVHFVMVNMTSGRETVESATSFVEKKGYEFPILFDTESDAAMTYGAYSLPTSFFINAQGHVIAQAVGPINGETLQRGIDMITN